MSNNNSNTRPQLGPRRSTSSVNLSNKFDGDESSAQDHSTSGPKKQTKQFVVHNRHNHNHNHNRVPSYGRNLNKLAKKITNTLSHDDLVAIAKEANVQQQQQHPTRLNSTSPGQLHSSRSREKLDKEKKKPRLGERKRSKGKDTTPKKAHFDLGSEPGSGSESETDEIVDEELVDGSLKSDGKDAWERVSMSTPKKTGSPQELANPPSDKNSKMNQKDPTTTAPAETKLVNGFSSTNPGKAAAASTSKQGVYATDLPDTHVSDKHADAETEAKSSTSQKVGTPIEDKKSLENTSKSEEKKAMTNNNNNNNNSSSNRQTFSNYFQGSNHQPKAAAPQVTAETATAYYEQSKSPMSPTDTNSSGGAVRRRDSQPVTSRFIVSDSPGRQGSSISPSSVATTPTRGTPSTPKTPHRATPNTPPSSSSPARISHIPPEPNPPAPITSTVKPPRATQPNRTQSKVLLQRQSSNVIPAPNGADSLQFDDNTRIHREALKEIEKVTREYANVRRFVTPLGEAVQRLKDSTKNGRIPPSSRNLERDGSGPGSLGLSQSLGANTNGSASGTATAKASKINVAASGATAAVNGIDKKSVLGLALGGSKDDSNVGAKRRSAGKMDEAKIRETLQYVWNRDSVANGSAE